MPQWSMAYVGYFWVGVAITLGSLLPPGILYANKFLSLFTSGGTNRYRVCYGVSFLSSQGSLCLEPRLLDIDYVTRPYSSGSSVVCFYLPLSVLFPCSISPSTLRALHPFCNMV